MAASRQTYVNDRFGATADVLAGWHVGTPPANATAWNSRRRTGSLADRLGQPECLGQA
jgi:hypothetical protein